MARNITVAWLLAVCPAGAGWAQPAPADVPSDTAISAPDSAVPAAGGAPASIPHALPTLPLASGWRGVQFPPRTEGLSRDLFAPAAPAAHGTGLRPFVVRNFGDRLMARMEREARRRANETLLTIAPDDGAPDSVLEEERAYHAERIIGRAINRSLDEQLEQVARTAWGLAPAFDWLEDFGHRRRSTPQDAADSPVASPAPRTARGFDGSVGVKIGAHPRLVMRGTFGRLSARIDVPILEDEIRISVERPLGAHGRAALVGAFPRGEPGRAFLGFNFNF